MQPAIELADIGVVRGAAWSIECLDRFGDRELVKLALASNSDSPAQRLRQRQDYQERYAEIFERDRQILWEQTAADDRFAKALILSNRLVADRVREYLPRWQQQPRTKIVRRLEHTLYRYLARAVGRTTPNGLWAGVSTFRCGEQTSCLATDAVCEFAPDLRPFQAILRALGTRSIYRTHSYWQVNPTLKQCGEIWQFWSLAAGNWCQIERNEAIDICLQIVGELSPSLGSEIVAHIAEILPSDADEWLSALIDVGAIVGGLDLPVRFDTVWDALVESSEKLQAGDRDLWELTIDRLHSLCRELSECWQEISSLELAEYLDAARIAIGELIAELDIAPTQIELPNRILHGDLKLPWDITLDRQQFDRLATTIAIYDRDWLDRTSPMMQLRRQQRQNLQSRLVNGVALNAIDSLCQIQQQWEDFADVAIDTPSIDRYLQTWTDLLTRSTESVYLHTSSEWDCEPIATAPLGCFYFTPLASGKAIVTGIDDDPARAFARFGKLLDPQEDLHSWLRHKLAEISTKHHLIITELQVTFPPNPNVIARRQFVAEKIDLWGANPDSLSLTTAQIILDRAARIPLLSIPSNPEPLAAFFFSTANISATDPIANLLLYTGFQERPIHTSALSLPIAAELATTIYTPRIHLENDEIIRPRRTVIDRQLLQELIDCSPPDRYARWQHLATTLGWSHLVNIRIDGEPGLLIKSDSPLAIESLFKSIKADTQLAIVEEVIDLPWLIDRDGNHYFAEFAIPFQRAKHGWSNLL